MKPENLIYVLIDPRNGEFRYIGLSSVGMIRPHKHMIEIRSNANDTTHKANWIRKLQSLGLEYKIGILQTLACPDQLPTAEMKFISCYKGMGCRLTNATDGGEGSLNPTNELREKMSKAKLGKKRPSEVCAKISKALEGNQYAAGTPSWNKGISPSEETRKKMSEAAKKRMRDQSGEKNHMYGKRGKDNPNYGKKFSLEARRKMSESAKKRCARQRAEKEAAQSAND